MKFLLAAFIVLAFEKLASAAVLLEYGTIVTFDDSIQAVTVLRNYSILVQNDRVSAIFSSNSSQNIPSDTERISAAGKIISPGFIDTHRHGWQTAWRTIASNTSGVEYFNRYGEYSQAKTRFTPDDVYYGQLFGLLDGINGGVTTTLDHAHSTWSNDTARSNLQASMDSGARVFWGYAFHDLGTNFTVADQIANFRDLNSNRNANGTSVEIGIAYDGFSIRSQTEVNMVLDVIKTSNISFLTTHFVEGPAELDNSPTRFQSLGLLNSTFPIVFAHGSYLSTFDASLLRQYNQHIVITPEAGAIFGMDDGVDVSLIQDQASLGVDCIFTQSSDILTQARMWLEAERQRSYSVAVNRWQQVTNNPMSVRQAFILATRSGGRTLRRDDIGVLRAGSKADLVVWDATAFNLLAWNDPVAAIILHANVGNVQHVMVNGVFRKRDFKLVSPFAKVDLANATARFLQSATRLQQLWLADPPTVVTGESAPGVPYVTVPNVDVLPGNQTGY